jgi:hypothetical protein
LKHFKNKIVVLFSSVAFSHKEQYWFFLARWPAKKPGSACLCGWQVFFGLIFFAYFL